jgi:parvulin-like peptidyl-prolyl isomerase
MTLVVNGEKIEDSAIVREMERLRPRYEQVFVGMDPEQRESQLRDWSKENVIERVLLHQEARKSSDQIPHSKVEYVLARLKQEYQDQQQLYKDLNAENDQKAMETLELQLKVEQKLNEITANLPKPTQADIERFYQDNKRLFASAEQVRVAHIVKYVDWRSDETSAFEAITKASEELKTGVPFESIVVKYTDCADGGDLGYLTRGQLVEEFEDVVFNLSAGQVSDIFRTRFGFHIAKLYDRKPPAIPSLEQVKKEVLGELKDQMRSDAIDGFLDQLRSRAKIEEV